MSVIEVAIVFPVLLFLLMAVFQFAIWYHGNQVVRAAAQDGARAARAEGSSDAEGQARAEAVLGAAGGTLFTSRSVEASRADDRVTVTVTGRVVSIVGIRFPAVTRSASGPIERFSGPGSP